MMNSALAVLIDNLNILAKLEKHERINVSSKQYDIWKTSIVPTEAVYRWVGGSDRKGDIDVIVNDYDTIMLIASLMLDSKKIKNMNEGDQENTTNLETLCQIYQSLLNSIEGLDNMCGTYIDDSVTRDRIRVLVDKITSYISTLRSSLTSLGCTVTADVRPRKYA